MNRYEDPSDPLNGPEHHSGKACVEKGCTSPAGTAWGPFWCQVHNAERMNRIDNNLKSMTFSAGLKKLGATIRPPSTGEGQARK